MANFHFGKNAKLYYGAADAAIGALTESGNVKDLTVNLTANLSDFTTRDNAGWRAQAANIRELTIDFQMVWRSGDATFEAIRDAFLNSTVLEIAALDQDRATAGAQGPKGNFTVSNFTEEQPIEEVIMVSVTLVLSKFAEWVEI